MSEAFVIIAQERSEEQEEVVEVVLSPAEVEELLLGEYMDEVADARRENKFGCSL